MNEKIILAHGSGGKLSHELIQSVFLKHFDNEILADQSDSAVLNMDTHLLAFTTDSFVVDPLFFPGGDIGKLAVAGTVNDLAVSGAIPAYLSCAFIIEEGLSFDDLIKIVQSMSAEARKAGVKIVCGDTKVVNKGHCDKIFINTSGIGFLDDQNKEIGKGTHIVPGDLILINGNIAEHGIAVMEARNDFKIQSNIKSDCASLNTMIMEMMKAGLDIRFMRDATRGGLATVLAEITENKNFGMELWEDKIPVDERVRGMCELLGYDPLYVANEGKVVIVISAKDAEDAIRIMKKHKEGTNAGIIGEVSPDHPAKVWLKTSIGGSRIIDMPAGEQLPRIC
jgi:hydrogenase expression/formation protein HypE